MFPKSAGVDQLVTRGVSLGGTIPGVTRLPDKYSENEITRHVGVADDDLPGAMDETGSRRSTGGRLRA
jgi:hypothetical protein